MGNAIRYFSQFKAMYDTVSLWLGADNLPPSYLNLVALHLSATKEILNQSTGEVSIYGSLRNLKVRLSERGICLKGSLPKFYLNDNFQVLSRGDTQRAIETLSDILHLQIKDAKVSRIDLAQNFILKHEESVYFSYLGVCNNYIRLEQPQSLYYQNSLRQMIFYCKAKEQRAKGLPVPELYKNKNVLRYEFRWLKRLPAAFNMAMLKASTLSDEAFYMEVINRWEQSYFSIRKQKEFNLDLELMNNAKDFEQKLLLAGIESIFGSERQALEAVDLARKQGKFSHKMQPQRLKEKIRALHSHSIIAQESEVIKELDTKVKEAVRYFR